jgi:hypothetical protein
MLLVSLGVCARLAVLPGLAFAQNSVPSPVPIPVPSPPPARQQEQGPNAAPSTPSPTPAAQKPTATIRVRKERPLAKRAARGEDVYQLPLRFDPNDNGLSIDNPQLTWIFRPENDVIDFGDFPVTSTDIKVTLDQISRAKAPVKYDARKLEKWITALSFRWPEALTRTGHISIETLQGDVRWRFQVNENERKLWREEVEHNTAEMKTNHMKSSWGRYDLVRSEFEFLYTGGVFRACLTNDETLAERLRVCTAPFLSKSKGDLIRFFPVKDNPTTATIPGFYLAGQRLKDSGILNFPVGKPLELRINFKTGAFVEISSQPADPKLLDVVESNNGKEILMTGAGALPLGKKVRILKKPNFHFWAPTGVLQESIWQAVFPADSPTIAVRGAFNIPFTLLFTYDQLPREGDRIFIEKTRSGGTFSAEAVVNGYIPSGGEVSSTESSAAKTGPYHFTWNFAAPKRGEENRSRLSINHKDGNRPWVVNHRMFRSYPSEVSGRITGIMTTDYTMLMLGEVSAGHYFETIGSSQNPRFSKQRWGLAGRYFQSLSTLQTSSGTGVSEFSVLNIDLKYHLLPGLWHRDELVGIMLSAERISISGLTVMLMGGGAYWARTMPKIFDDLFNLLPLMEYPKYVDMEFIYYPISLTSGTSGGLSFCLNFHGRVIWTQRFYGEIGFGIRSYQFVTPSQTRSGQTANISLLTSYGTAGLGFIF